MIDEVKYCDKSKELIELGFRPAMCINNETAIELYEYMTKKRIMVLMYS